MAGRHVLPFKKMTSTSSYCVHLDSKLRCPHPSGIQNEERHLELILGQFKVLNGALKILKIVVSSRLCGNAV